MNKEFPNGITSYLETYYKVVEYLTSTHNMKGSISLTTREQGGTGAMYQLAEQLTDEFENLNKGREWDGEFFDEIEKFLDEKDNNVINYLTITNIDDKTRKEKIQEIKILVEKEIEKHRNEDYWNTEEANQYEQIILNKLLEIGYNYELDNETTEYCLNATDPEIWQYYLDVVIPKL